MFFFKKYNLSSYFLRKSVPKHVIFYFKTVVFSKIKSILSLFYWKPLFLWFYKIFSHQGYPGNSAVNLIFFYWKNVFFFKKIKIHFFVLDQFDFLPQTAGPKLKIKWYIQVFKKVKKWKPPRKACSKVSFFDIFSVLGPYTRAKSCFSEKIFSVLRRNTTTLPLFFFKKLTFF